MKNKFFVGIEIVLMYAILFVVCVGCFIGFASDIFKEDLWVIILFTAMLAMLPTVLFILIVYLYAAKVQIDEEGITKSLFGIKQKKYRWEELSNIKFYGNIVALSISFYKERNKKSIIYRFSKNERIFIMLDDKRREVIMKYAPEYIREKYLKNWEVK